MKILSAEIEYVELINNGKAGKILHDISFNLQKGSIYTVLGKNGSGKSTLINSLTNLLDPSYFIIKGSVEFKGMNLLELDEPEMSKIRREDIRYVFQDSINGFDHLKKFEYYFKRLDVPDDEIGGMLDYFLLPEKSKLMQLYPYEVSGGMAQRISICLAFLSQPVLLILDEPNSAVDINISNLLYRKSREYVKENDSTILLITQDLDFAGRISDYMAKMSGGTLSEFYTVSEYKKNFAEK